MPYSILDRRFENSLIKLKNLDVEIHVRSVFLQGLYFKDLNNLPETLLPLRPYLRKLHEICNSFNISIPSLALNFVKQNKNIDKIVIGAESKAQLEDNITVMNMDIDNNILELIDKLDVVEKELLNPINWN